LPIQVIKKEKRATRQYHGRIGPTRAVLELSTPHSSCRTGEADAHLRHGLGHTAAERRAGRRPRSGQPRDSTAAGRLRRHSLPCARGRRLENGEKRRTASQKSERHLAWRPIMRGSDLCEHSPTLLVKYRKTPMAERTVSCQGHAVPFTPRQYVPRARLRVPAYDTVPDCRRGRPPSGQQSPRLLSNRARRSC